MAVGVPCMVPEDSDKKIGRKDEDDDKVLMHSAFYDVKFD